MIPVSEFTLGRLRAELADIEAAEDIRILFAVDAGPRGAGFHANDSLYVVRFVYARPLDWHYRLGPLPDTIDRPVAGSRDITGWQLNRVLNGLLASNAVVAEWLRSPVVYVPNDAALRDLSILAERMMDRTTVTQHYLTRLRRTGAGRPLEVELGHYLGHLRAAFALRWIRVNGAAMPPFDLGALIEGADVPPDLEERVNFLWAQRTTQPEGVVTLPTDPELDAMIADERAAGEEWIKRAPKPLRPDMLEEANALHLSLSSPTEATASITRAM